MFCRSLRPVEGYLLAVSGPLTRPVTATGYGIQADTLEFHASYPISFRDNTSS